jgi:hypothetical protein
VVKPIDRLEPNREDSTQSVDNAMIEVQISAQQYQELGLIEGEALAPRYARVFVEG